MEEDQLSLTRRESIRKIIKEQKIDRQSKIVGILKEEHEIRTDQSTVSRDLRILKIVKDKNGQYTLSKAEEDKKNKDDLYSVLSKAETIIPDDSDYVPFPFRCDPMYADAVCTHLEKALNSSLDKDFEVFAMKGPTGSVCLFIPKPREKEIKQLIDSFIDSHI